MEYLLWPGTVLMMGIHGEQNYMWLLGSWSFRFTWEESLKSNVHIDKNVTTAEILKEKNVVPRVCIIKESVQDCSSDQEMKGLRSCN